MPSKPFENWLPVFQLPRCHLLPPLHQPATRRAEATICPMLARQTVEDRNGGVHRPMCNSSAVEADLRAASHTSFRDSRHISQGLDNQRSEELPCPLRSDHLHSQRRVRCVEIRYGPFEESGVEAALTQYA